MAKFYQVTHIIFFIATFTASLGDLLHVSVAYMTDHSLLSYAENPYMVLADIGYFISTIILYCLLFGRLYFTFNQTGYALSNGIVIFYIIIIIAAMIMFGLYFVFWYDSGLKVIILLIAISTNDLILNITLTVLFIKKIRALVISESDFNLDVDIAIQSEIKFNNRQYKMLHLIIKYGILSILIIILKQEFNLWYLIQLLWLNQSGDHVAIGCGLRGLENIITVIIIYIALHFNMKLYEKLCGKCHGYCLKCCTNG